MNNTTIHAGHPTRRMFAWVLLFLAIFFGNAFAQVNGLSYHLAPEAGYFQWHDNAGLSDDAYVGGRLGIGFGEYLELQARYVSAIKQNRSFESFSGLEANQFGALQELDYRKVELTRVGGALRVNLGRGFTVPFIFAGTGVQQIKPADLEKTESIYIEAGAGLSFSIEDRMSLSLFVQNTGFRMNPGSALLSEAELASSELSVTDFQREDLTNWSIGASLSAYLGGRRPGTLSDIDRDVIDQFSRGFGGLSVPIEPFVGRIDFPDEVGFRDTDVAGVDVGLDFGRLIGIRAFYWRPLKQDEWREFEDMAIYGGELNLRLSEGSGLTPYLTLGGGLINAGDEYRGVDDAIVKDQPFASAGAGLLLPINRNLMLHGGVRALVMSDSDVEDLESTDQLYTGWTYRAGLSFSLGQPPSRPKLVRQQVYEDAVLEQEMLAARDEARSRELAALAEQYDARITLLQQALARAQARGDSLASRELTMQLGTTEAIRDDILLTETAEPPPLPEIDASAAVESNRDPYGPERVKRIGDRDFIMVPVPETGEIYVRFGEPGAVKIESGKEMVHEPGVSSESALRKLIRDVLDEHADEMRRARELEMLEARLGRLEARIRDEGRMESDSNTDKPDVSEIEMLLNILSDRETQNQRPQTQVQNDELLNSRSSLDSLLTSIEARLSKLTATQQPGARKDTTIQVEVKVETDLEIPKENALRVELVQSEQKPDAPMEPRVVEKIIVVVDSTRVTKPVENLSDVEEAVDLDAAKVRIDDHYDVPMAQENAEDADEDSMTVSGESTGFFDNLRYSRFAVIGGAALNPDSFSPSIGLRAFFDSGNSPYTLYPEIVFGRGAETYTSVSVNAMRYFNFAGLENLAPYAGLGLGVAGFSKTSNSPSMKPTVNLVVGTELPVANGMTFVDFTTRNFLQMNQLVGGYYIVF